MILRGLYAITDSRLGESLPAAVEAALAGGATMVQYRDKSSDHARRAREARALLAICQRWQRPLLINDDVELALETGADGVHLGQGDGSLTEARARLGNRAIIGITCHDSLALAEAAATAGADYLAFGAFFASTTKPAARTAGLQVLRDARIRFRQPLVAIGGITTDNAPSLLEAGADCLAVISDLWSAPDITQQAHAYGALFRQP